MTSARRSRDMVRAHRDRLRAKGLRPVQIWVPDVRTPEFKAEAARQSRAVAAGAEEADVTAFIEAAADGGDEPWSGAAWSPSPGEGLISNSLDTADLAELSAGYM